MCIIIDTNTLHSVFDPKSQNHAEFKPVYDWVRTGEGKVVYGGTKYLEELKGKYLGLINEMRKIKRAVLVNAQQIDAEEAVVSNMIQDPDFDDQHLVGLLRVSGCKLICSADQRGHPFFKHPTFFSPAAKRPKIYTGLATVNLLTRNNIAQVCRN